MVYKNVTAAIAYPMIDYVRENWIESKDPFERHILGRFALIGLTPIPMITLAIDTIIGLGATFATILTAGTHPATYYFYKRHVSTASILLDPAYTCLLGFINPNALLNERLESPAVIAFEGTGFVTNFADDYLSKIANDFDKSKNIFYRHVMTRLTLVLKALACAVTRAVDGVIAVPAVVTSFCTLGMFPSVNNLAWRSLKATGIISDLLFCTVKIINPNAGYP